MLAHTKPVYTNLSSRNQKNKVPKSSNVVYTQIRAHTYAHKHTCAHMPHGERDLKDPHATYAFPMERSSPFAPQSLKVRPNFKKPKLQFHLPNNFSPITDSQVYHVWDRKETTQHLSRLPNLPIVQSLRKAILQKIISSSSRR